MTEIPIRQHTPREAAFKMSLKALALQGELNVERERCDTWRKLANGYDDIRSWLRLCNDDPEGHAEFYKQACLIVFGHYGDDEFADAPEDDGG